MVCIFRTPAEKYNCGTLCFIPHLEKIPVGTLALYHGHASITFWSSLWTIQQKVPLLVTIKADNCCSCFASTVLSHIVHLVTFEVVYPQWS